jgi:hypothetical protein
MGETDIFIGSDSSQTGIPLALSTDSRQILLPPVRAFAVAHLSDHHRCDDAVFPIHDPGLPDDRGV